VILVRHDDAPKLMFRSLEEFFRAAVDAVSGPMKGDDEYEMPFLDTSQLPTVFDGSKRSGKDRTTGRALLALGEKEKGLSKHDQSDAFRFACDLLAPEDTAAFKTLLKVGDEYVREHVLRRMERLRVPRARRMVRNEKEGCAAFVKKCATWLKAAGLKATVEAPHGKPTIRILPGPIGLNMEMFYSQRTRPDFKEHFVGRVKTLCKQR
jgi:hypothetical protein